jgi:uncharacterized membrane protein YbhN (UPF0104 family)
MSESSPPESSSEPESDVSEERGMSSQSRTLRNSIVSLALFFAIVVALLLAVPGLHSVLAHLEDANPGWVAAAIGLEVLSCVSFVVLFDLVFGKLGRSLSSRLSLAELAVNSVVSVSGMGGLALGAWVLRSKGISVERIAKRSVLIFVLTSAVNVGAVVVIGVPMWLGLLPGSRDALLTLLPSAAALIAISGGVHDALGLIAAHDWRLLGAVGYWLFDNIALYACLAAFGHAPAFWGVAMAYLVGMLANSIPIPGGFVAVEGGLVGMLLLFGARPASAVVAAVVIYRAISLWLPSIIGAVAFLSLRREIGKPLRPQPGGVAGS